ncbi:hypothetical protein D3C86_2144450 [compost metagenome]
MVVKAAEFSTQAIVKRMCGNVGAEGRRIDKKLCKRVFDRDGGIADGDLCFLFGCLAAGGNNQRQGNEQCDFLHICTRSRIAPI